MLSRCGAPTRLQSELPRLVEVGVVHFEYDLLGLPAPTLVFYLDVPTGLTEKMMREREQATNTKADIHEKDEAYLRSCRENARKVAERCGWQRIDCSRCGQMRFIEDIHEEIYQRVKALL